MNCEILVFHMDPVELKSYSQKHVNRVYIHGMCCLYILSLERRVFRLVKLFIKDAVLWV